MAGVTGEEVDTTGGGLDVSRQVVESAIVLVGVLLAASTVSAWYWTEIDPFEAFVVGLPAALLITSVGVVRRYSVPQMVYTDMLRWTILGFVALGGFITGVLVVLETSLVDSLSLLLFMTGFGAAAGLLVGFSRGQSRQAELKTARLERQQARIEFLNHLLRHNVLNKIAIIKGHAELLDAEYDIEDPSLPTIIDQSEDVSELIENVRVLVASFSSQTELEPTDLSSALQSEVASLRQSFEDAAIHADVPDGLHVYADGLLRYTFENVLHNAVQHNDADTPAIEVSARRSGEAVVVTVADNGPGVSDVVTHGIEEAEVTGSHGIGLYLVDTLLTEYGGAMQIDDNEPRGTRVTLRFRPADDAIEQ